MAQIPRSGIWNIREIAKSGTCYFYGSYPIEMLMVGGGGSGGDWAGTMNGGGGAGGLIYTSSLVVERGTCYTVTVGAGAPQPGHVVGAPGSNTCFVFSPTTTLVALRGMGGMSSPHVPCYGGHTGVNGTAPLDPPTACPLPSGSPGGYGCSFGSGGGAGDRSRGCPAGGFGCQPQSRWWCNIPNTVGCGRPGGDYSFFCCAPNPACNIECGGGGGGGASEAGCQPSPNPTFPSGPRSLSGRGGRGLCYSISGSTIGYAGGGGARYDGGNTTICCHGNELPRPFGGGCACWNTCPHPWGWANQNYACPGIANRGGGGTAGNNWAGICADHGGGSGVVIIRYDGLQIGAGGNVISTTLTPIIRTVHTFTGSGTFEA